MEVRCRDGIARGLPFTDAVATQAGTLGQVFARHVEILCAALARVNVSVLYQFVDTAKRSWPTSVTPAGDSSIGQRVARSSERWPAFLPRRRDLSMVQGHDSRLEGQPWSLPLSNRSEIGRRDARPCFDRRPVALLRRLRVDFGVRYLGFGLFCARCSRRPRHSPEVLALTWAS